MNNQTTNICNAQLAERIVERFFEAETLDLDRLHLIIVEELEQASFAGAISYGAALIARERERQVEGEGFTAEHDDRWQDEQLIDAAACYLFPTDQVIFDMHWPWDLDWFKPKDRVSDLVRAGALIAAELDRLQRASVGDMPAPADAGPLYFASDPDDDRLPFDDAGEGEADDDLSDDPEYERSGDWVIWVGDRSWPGDDEEEAASRQRLEEQGDAIEALANRVHDLVTIPLGHGPGETPFPEIGDGFDDVAPDEVAEAIDLDLGPCCACLKTPATGFAFLPFRAPEPGTGWGCLVCGLPQDGAIAVLCDECGDGGAETNEVCKGRPGDGGRINLGRMKLEPFEHDLSKHPEYTDIPGHRRVAWLHQANPWAAPTAPPPDDSELLRQMVESFDGAPPVNLEMSAFEAFNMVGLMQLCLRMAIPPNVRAIALELARRFEGKVNEAAPGLEEMMGLGYDPRHDRDADGRPIHPEAGRDG